MSHQSLIAARVEHYKSAVTQIIKTTCRHLIKSAITTITRWKMFTLTQVPEALKPAAELISAISDRHLYITSSNDLSGDKAYVAVKIQSPDQRKVLILQLLDYLIWASPKRQDEHDTYFESTILIVISGLLRSNLDYDEQEWMTLIDKFSSVLEQLPQRAHQDYFDHLPMNYAIQQIERYLKQNKLSKTLADFIKQLMTSEIFANKDEKSYYGVDFKTAYRKLSDLIQPATGVLAFTLPAKDIGEAVNAVIAQSIDSLDSLEGADKRTAYYQIFHHTGLATGSKPSQKYLDSTKAAIETIGKDAYRNLVHELLHIAVEQKLKTTTGYYDPDNRRHPYEQTVYLEEASRQFLKGLIWTLDGFSDRTTISLLERLLLKSYHKISGVGPAAPSVGNACVYVLGNMRGKDGLGALARASLSLKQKNIQKLIDKQLIAGAKKYGISIEELAEMSVPDFGMIEGRKVYEFADYQLMVSIEDGKIKQQWYKLAAGDSSPMKSVPSVVKSSETLSQKLKEARREIKEIQQVYSAQKQRLDNQFILNRHWDKDSFDRYYLNHGLVSTLARPLIWRLSLTDPINQTVKETSALYIDDTWQDAIGAPIDWLNDWGSKQATGNTGSLQICLWHPVFANEADILAWRERMMNLELKQPIKQAFREIYLLTDAEIATRTYSNRMAAHILKQHQFNALAKLRGWQYTMMGMFDHGSDGICRKELTQAGLIAEFWLDEIHNEGQSDSVMWPYVGTDQVKFKTVSGETVNLADVPDVIFSEVMRDVDLFVGVCSVGNDPQWRDNQGERDDFRDYWQSYSFGDLSEIAKTRESILQGLLPRLKKIRDVAHIDGNFLIVEGKLRTYKIHIGSGNILMLPNDQYLCIVPDRGGKDPLEASFIPFEGDTGLSIVLSKAFLLAEDSKITDPTIVSQINHGR